MSSLALPGSRRFSLTSALARRGWIVIVCMLAVGALAYLVSSVQSATYTAVTGLAVDPALGGPSPGNAQAASELASTYAGAMPHDERTLAYVARKTGGGGAIAAVPQPGTSVITATFYGDSPAQAFAGARAIGDAVAGPSPQSLTVAPDAVEVIQRPSEARRVGGRWAASIVLFVATGVGPGAGIDADRANKLAVTYAGVIGADQNLQARAGQVLGESRDDVAAHLGVINPQNTSLLFVSFKAGSEQQAVKGANALASLITGPAPAAATIVPSSIKVISRPTGAKATSGGSSSSIPIGLLIGLALGLVLLIAWERSDPHIGEARELSSQLGVPATAVEQLSSEAAGALLDRWAALTDHVPARVAMLPADASAQSASEHVVKMLLEAGGHRTTYKDARQFASNGAPPGGAVSAAGDLVLVQAGTPGEGAGQAIALKCDLTVVVVARGTRAAELRALADNLAQYGIVPDWSLLTPRQPSQPVAREPVGAMGG